MESLEPRFLLTGQVIISEIMAVNEATRVDQFGEYSDWIELYNAADETIDLHGHFLTDDPRNPAKWMLPQVTIPPRDFLVIAASGRNLRDPAAELHTNFALNRDGEYVAIVGPDRTEVIDQLYFGPQEPDVSYGFGAFFEKRDEDILVSNESAGHLLVPVSTDAGSLSSMFETHFEIDERWLPITGSVGFDNEVSQSPADPIRIDFSRTSSAGIEPLQEGWIGLGHETDGGERVEFDVEDDSLPSPITIAVSGNTHWRDYVPAILQFAPLSDMLSDGPLCNAGCTMQLELRGLPTGLYSFTGYSHTTQFGPSERAIVPVDVLLSDSQVVEQLVVDNLLTSDNRSDLLSTFTFEFRAIAGQPVEMRFERPNHPTAQGHFALPGLEIQRLGDTVLAHVATDVHAAMYGQNATALVRYPFWFDGAAVDELLLDIQYNDGIAAYLNGTSIEQRNAPNLPEWNSSAPTDRSITESLVVERIDLTSHMDVLAQGDNVLALHGVNVSPDDADFLISACLTTATLSDAERVGHFEQPTPGSFNTTADYLGFVDLPAMDREHGMIDTASDAFDLALSGATPGAQIVYTLDGSLPTVTADGDVINGTVYDEPLWVDRTTAVRAVAFLPGYRTSAAVTKTYLFLDDVLDQSSTPPEGYPETWGGTFTDWGLDQDPDDLAAIAGDSGLSLEEAREIIKNSLRSLPTLSIVLDVDDMFGASNGIYSNTQREGPEWERPASFEWIDPTGDGLDFQIDAGLRLQGFTSRIPDRNPKHSFRVVFRDEYGDTRLRYPVFGPDGADSFDTLVLRSNSQDAWVYNTTSNRQGQFVRDQWARETQLALGGNAARGNWVHLYINGLYWGVYNPTERPDHSFMEEYVGGDKSDYDVIKNHEEVISGDDRAYNELLALIQNNSRNFDAGYRDLSDDAAYQRTLGNNPDGTRNDDYPVYINVESLAKFVIVGAFAAAEDWPGNYYMARDRSPTSTGFQFFMWDNEHGMKSSASVNRTVGHWRDKDSPTKFHHALRQHAEYRLLFADQLHRAFFNGGPLYVDPDNDVWNPDDPERNMPGTLWMELTGQIEAGLIAEAVRWGDVRGVQYSPHDQFQDLRHGLLANWFTRRSRIVFAQFRRQGLYPDTEAPVFNRHGGHVSDEFLLEMSHGNDIGAIYYTLDGTDPQHSHLTYTQPITLSGTVVVKARVLRDGEWSALNEATFDAGPPTVRIAEVNYNPYAPTAFEQSVLPDVDNDRFEFIEILNTHPTQTISLKGYELRDAVRFAFDDDVTLAPGEIAVVVEDPTAFHTRYDPAGIPIRVLGQWSGRLANDGETIILVDSDGDLIQQIIYTDVSPWPEVADGAGSTLMLSSSLESSNAELGHPSRWRSSITLGGTPGVLNDLEGDIDKNGQIESFDIDLIAAGIRGEDLTYDFNRDTQLDEDDSRWFVTYVLNTSAGDANVDGEFNTRDFVRVFQAGQYEDAIPRNSTWATGDWNGDGEFDSSDLVMAFQTGQYEIKSVMGAIGNAAAVDWLLSDDQWCETIRLSKCFSHCRSAPDLTTLCFHVPHDRRYRA